MPRKAGWLHAHVVIVSCSLTSSMIHLFIESVVCIIVCYIGVRSRIEKAQQQQTQLHLSLPEISTKDFERSWIRFNLGTAAKNWDEAKQFSIVHALLAGSL